MSIGDLLIRCPICGGTFPPDYYDEWHVPCPGADERSLGGSPNRSEATR